MKVLIATTNRGKLAELRELLGDLPIELLTLDDALPGQPPVEETGATFEENALLKARAAADATGMVTIADDSGLEVDALDGRPGVRSARYAKEGATDAENIAKLLAELEGVEDDHRTARFRCAMVLIDPRRGGEPVIVDGRCEGAIGHEPRGEGGFGYDPVFIIHADQAIPDGTPEAEIVTRAVGHTMAEISSAEKNVVSHRAQATAQIKPILASLLKEGSRPTPP
jgi:XTP/dITP diphosphohydrolase